jgi:hypothetical protein
MKKLLVIVAIAVIGVAAWRVRSHSSADAQDGKDLLVGRLWVDRLPTSERDQFNLFAVGPQGLFGIFQTRSRWVGSYEVFRADRSGSGIVAEFPQSGRTEKLAVKARRCNEKGMDFCMDITGNSLGAHRYYSRKEWVVKSLADEQALAAQLDEAR